MAILMNIKDSIIVTIMYISPHDKPCPRKCGKLLPKKGEKKRVYKTQDSNQKTDGCMGLLLDNHPSNLLSFIGN